MQHIPYGTEVVFTLAICLISSFILNRVSERLKLPSMIAPLLIGLLINFYIIGDIIYFIPNFTLIVQTFANLALILIMFFIGLRVDFHYMGDLSKNSSIMALNAGLIPFELGFFASYIYTQNIPTSLFVGLALAITAEEVSITILDELRMLKKRVGQLIIEAGIIGDVFEIAAIAFLGFFIRAKTVGSITLLTFILEIFAFIFVVILMRFYVIEFLLDIPDRKSRKYEYFAVAFIILIIMAAISELLNFSAIIGALAAGMLLKNKLIKDRMYYHEHIIIEAIEVFHFGIFEPIVFIFIGLSVDPAMLFENIGFGLILTFLALFGKIAGALVGNYFCGEPLSEGILIGWGLNARGATELFALLIAQNLGIVSEDIFAAIVLMAILTTIISPIVFKMLVRNGYGLVKHVHSRNKHVYKSDRAKA